ncbi:MAG: trypsin-like peptidase domain-containing protein [Saccharothrix sp.]|nr:trypsin-like peptidase domain-containing protein [Saccharothrix sp.]
MELAERALVRVFHDGTPVGVGFLVGPDLVVTCDHVVAGGPVTVDFPLVGGETTAEVVHRDPESDVAGLRLRDVPPGARAVRVVAHDDLRDHEVRAFGVPANRPDGVWVPGTIRGALAHGRLHIEDTRSHGLPIAPGFSGGPVLDDTLGAVVGMVTSVESRPEHRTAYALSGAALHRAWDALSAPLPTPFRGLEPFREQDAEHFHGRAADATDLRARLDRDGVVVVTGPSGSGKSSLVLAGLLPLLDGHKLVLRATWRGLSAALDTRVSPGHVEDAVNRLVVRHDLRRLTLVLDQYDEAVARFPDEAPLVLAELLAATRVRAPRVDLVVTTTPGPALDSAPAHHVVPVGPPDLRAVVEGPLRAPGMPVLQTGLADAVLRDLEDERNPLPLLEFTLTLLWERQERGVLTHAAYRELGGVAGAVATYAESVSGTFTESRLRHALTQLVSPLEGGGFVRRQVPRAELGAIATRLAGTRLVTLGPSTVELAHESLVRHWPRLRDWVEEDRSFRLWQDDLDRTAHRWTQTRDASLLPRGRTLQRAQREARDRQLPDHQRRLLDTAVQRQNWRIVLRSVAVMVIALLTIGLVAVFQATRESVTRLAATSAASTLLNPLTTESAGRRVVNAVRAHRTVDNLDTRTNLHGVAVAFRHVRLLVDGNALASADGGRVLKPGTPTRLWDVTTDPPTVTEPGLPGRSFAWVDDRRLLVFDPGLAVHDVVTGTSTPITSDDVAAAVADPTGGLIAYGASGATTVRVRGPNGEMTLALPGRLEVSAVRLLAVRPGPEVVVAHRDRVLVVSQEGTVDLPDGDRVRCSGADRSDVCEVPGSAQVVGGILRVRVDGRQRSVPVPDRTSVVATAVEPSGAVRVVLRDPGSVAVVRVPPPDALDEVLAAAESSRRLPDGTHVLVESAGRVETWDVVRRARVAAVDVPPRIGSALSPDASLYARAIGDGVAVWSLPALTPVGAPIAADEVADVLFLDAQRLLVRDAHGVAVRDLRTGNPQGPPVVLDGPVVDAVPIDDEMVVVTREGRVVRVTIRAGRVVPGSEVRSGPGVRVAAGFGHLATADGRDVVVRSLAGNRQVGRLRLKPGVPVQGLRFREEDKLEIALGEDETVGVLLWNRLRSSDLLDLQDIPLEPLSLLPGGDDAARWPVDPEQWVGGLCALVLRSGIDQGTEDLPDGAHPGAVC